MSIKIPGQSQAGGGGKKDGPKKDEGGALKDLNRAVAAAMLQNSNRPEATENIEDLLYQAFLELGKLSSGYMWGEPKEKLKERWGHLLMLLLHGAKKGEIDLEAAVKERLTALPGLPMPGKGGNRARGLRL